MAEKACDGGRTLMDWSGAEMVECAECGRGVRWDLTDDPFWGFQNCRDKSPVTRKASDNYDAHQRAAQRRTCSVCKREFDVTHAPRIFTCATCRDAAEKGKG